MNEYTLEVTEVIKRTPMSTSVRIEKPDGFKYLPGQWAQFTLSVNGGKESRPLSLSSSPTEPFLEFTKRISGSDFSQTVRNLKPGDAIYLKGPAGNLVYTGGLDVVTFIAGGIGITPIRSILKFLTDNSVKGKKTFIYGNLNIEETAYREEIESWETKDSELKVVHVLEKPSKDWTGHTGFINRKVIEESVQDLADQTFYVSGPPPMVNAINGALDELNVAQEKRVTEKLEGYESMV